MAQKRSHNITRRGFVVGATAAAASAALTLEGCNSTSASETLLEEVREAFPDAKVEYLAVDPSDVHIYTDLNEADATNYVQETQNFNLPVGSLLFQSSDTKALVIGPGESSKSLICLGLVNLDGGKHTIALGQALGASEDYVIYDARASASTICWVECNMVHGLWRVYATTLAEGAEREQPLQGAELLDEGDGEYSPPLLAVSDNKVYWTVMPDPNGPRYTEDSYLKCTKITRRNAADKAETVYVSHGRMITNPVVSDDVLTIVPRVDTDGVYYQLTSLDIATDTVKNISILPPSVRVSDAVWLGEGFAFSMEGNYDYAGGLAYFGTYLQQADGRYLYVSKAPVCPAMQLKKHTYIKSTKNVLGIGADSGNLMIVDTPQNCVSYGDILAGAGIQNRLVVYTTVFSNFGDGAGVCNVRVFDSV